MFLPGTQVIKRLKRGDPCRTASDCVSQRHDIDYVIASTKKGPLKAKLAREADQRMVRKLKEIKKNKKDNPRNIALGQRLIQAKMLGEDAGLLSADKFVGESKVTDPDMSLLIKSKVDLAQKGYGLKPMYKVAKPVLPGELLRKSLMKKHGSKKRQKMSGKGGLMISRTSKGKSVGTSKGYNLVGSGITLPGGGIKNVKKWSMKLLKKMMKKLKIGSKHLRKQLASDTLGVAISEAQKDGGSIKDVAKRVAERSLPLLLDAKLKDAGFKKGLAGSKINIGGDKKKLLKSLGMFGLSSLQDHLNEQSGQGGGKIRIVKSKPGEFWKDFAKGFTWAWKKLIKPVKALVKTIAPEVSAPLEAIDSLIPDKKLTFQDLLVK